MIPPVFVSFHLNWFWIPIPVFFLWPLFISTWLLFSLALSFALVLVRGDISRSGSICIEAWRLFCAIRGTRVELGKSGFRLRLGLFSQRRSV